MIYKITRSSFLLLFIFYNFLIGQTNSNTSKVTRILIVFDASNSMSGKWQGVEKITTAKTLFNKLIDSLKKIPNTQFALRVYGSTVKYPPGDCQDSKLLIPFKVNNIQEIKNAVSKLQPTGITPIEYSLIESAKDFPDSKALNNIIIITDGIEECKGDICKAKQFLESNGIIFKPFIIGIGLTAQQSKSFDCVGNYYNSDQNDLYKNINNILLQQKLNNTTLQINLLDIASRPLETNINVTLYDAKQKSYITSYIHSLNSLNNPDTLYASPYLSYKAIAYTIPPVESNIQTLNEGKHNIIAIDVPQGGLYLQRQKGNFNFNEKVRCVIRSIKNNQILNVQNLNTSEKYIVGDYKIEILTLPIIQQDIQIQSAKTQTLSIPSSGMLSIQTIEVGDGCIMLEKNNQLQWVTNLSTSTQQNYYLLPGKYRILWRAKSMRSSIYTIEKKIEIKPDMSETIKLY